MKHRQVLAAAFVALCAIAAQAATPTPGITPVDMRGLWFLKNEEGAAKCAAYLGRKPVEPDPGALVIDERQLQQWAENTQTTMYFVTDVLPRRVNTWRMQALVDVPPTRSPKRWRPMSSSCDRTSCSGPAAGAPTRRTSPWTPRCSRAAAIEASGFEGERI